MSIFKKKKITDWMLLHGIRGTWKITTNGREYDDSCNYEIYYSPSADKIKLETNGYQPKGHTLYNSIMKVIGIYNAAILENKPFNDIKKQVDEMLKIAEK